MSAEGAREAAPRIPPPPPLVREQVYDPLPEPMYTYEEILRMRQREQQRQRALAQVAPIRNHFR